MERELWLGRGKWKKGWRKETEAGKKENGREDEGSGSHAGRIVLRDAR